MVSKKLIIITAVLAIASLACSVTLNAPTVDVVTGPTVTEDILVESLDTVEATKVELNFGAGQLFLEPGASALIEGTATYNVEELQPEVDSSNERVLISTGDNSFTLDFNSIPNFTIDDIENRWDLQLGEDIIDLVIQSGAYEGDMELGGLALENLTISDGAADVKVTFSEVNPVEMTQLNYDSGASNIELSGLANANFGYMSFDAGLGDYTLDFSGELQQDAIVDVVAGLSNVTIIVPEGTDVVVNIDAGLANVDTSGDWSRSGGNYTMDGEGPTLIINVDIGAGNLELQN
ncbi:MAG: hypothetical protein DWQ07_14405 [Chloroflexi bacterium]|nr:MAG: hypothetical protein DWQ07_14405 [Chloroflexota bacterium]MBL1195725.1 hypothetical protein [Chloroflexota bacterium]NOH13013.1 hypothetical protein [Chloroflexota bacterium]